ncbi:hypothetical protein [Kocuria palustris]|uniref:hypothetical protein n=1 Tax=Kocuria palustris TaxID=71999 RepID=UPI0035DCE9B4
MPALGAPTPSTISRRRVLHTAYDPATCTTRLQWMIPAGTRVTSESRSSRNPQILFTFRNGASSTSGAGRITNTVVIRSIAGGCIVEPGSLPLDPSVVEDLRGVSADGIY